jgi:glycosyltransferase involved in cell wall biosynthesis
VIISFEKKDLFERDHQAISVQLEEYDILWIPLSYTKSPPVLSTLKDILTGYRISSRLHKKYKFQIVHCRGYITAIIGSMLKRKGLKFIFDMRGWWPDEKKESGFWNNKMYEPVYHYFKRLEKSFFRNCDFAISLTEKGKREIVRLNLAPSEKVGVIPTCVDFDIFKAPDHAIRSEVRGKLGIEDHEKVFVYSGSLGGNYQLQILIDIYKAFREVHPESLLLILSKEEESRSLLAEFKKAGIERVAIIHVPFPEVTDFLRASDIAFVYYKLTYSTIGRSPTKLAEYWASGLPVISFSGIGDLDFIFKKFPKGGILLSHDGADWAEQFKSLPCGIQPELRGYSEEFFHLDKGVRFYQDVYNRLVPEKNGLENKIVFKQ